MTEDIKELEKSITTTQEKALALAVTNTETYVQAGELLKLHKGLEKQIKGYFDPLKKKAHESWKAICNAENTELDKLQPALKYLNQQMTSWNLEQERLRVAEENRLRREAEKAEEERRLQAALEAEASGAKEEASAILEEPIYVPPPIVEKVVPKVSGQTMTTTWKWRVKDINLVPRQYLTTNDTAINSVVRGMKDKANIPGIEVYPESSMRGVRS